MARSDTEADASAEQLYFPSREWFSVYQERINESETYAEQGADWGVDFNGDFIFEMRGMPVDEMDTEAMPAHLREDMEEYVVEEDGTYVGYSFVGLEGGECTDARLIQSKDEVDPGFVLAADDETWKQLMRSEIGVVDGMMSGEFEIEGDMQKVMQYSQAAITLTDIAAEIDAEFADEAFAK
jgi:putative sterol carrier protein